MKGKNSGFLGNKAYNKGPNLAQLAKNNTSFSSRNTPKKNKKGGKYSGIRMIFTLLCFIIAGLLLTAGISLIQSAAQGKDQFISRLEFYVNLANPYKRFVYLYPGMRREEIVEKFATTLNWDDKDKRWFIASAPADAENGGYMEGYFLTKPYFVDKDASGKEVGELLHDEFIAAVSEKVLDKETGEKSAESDEKTITGTGNKKEVINLDLAIRIASIIQREAAGPHDMRIVSGVIWNRVFAGMSLDMDATLQYVKGKEDNWWPRVQSKDKYLESPYNTYKNKGIPPGAISNPSIDAINAAYNPQKTDCLFYIHDNNRQIHCEKTYEKHVQNVNTYLK